MNGVNLSVVDQSVIIAMFLMSLAIGIYFGVFNNSPQTANYYLFADYKSNSLLIGISLIVRYTVYLFCFASVDMKLIIQ